MLQGRGLPHFDAAGASSHNPLSERDDLGDVLAEAAGDFELADLLSALEQPYSARRLRALSAPGSDNDLLPCERCGNILGGLGAGDEDKTEALLQIVGLEGAADGGGDLECRLAEGQRGKGYVGGRDQANSLCSSQHRLLSVALNGSSGAYPEGRKDLGLVYYGPRAVVLVDIEALALCNRAGGRGIRDLGAGHRCCRPASVMCSLFAWMRQTPAGVPSPIKISAEMR